MKNNIMPLPMPPRGQPPKDPSKLAAYLTQQQAARDAGTYAQGKAFKAVGVAADSPRRQIKIESDKDIIERVEARFEVYYRLCRATAFGEQRSLLVTGAGGVGKTYAAERILEAAGEQGVKSETVHGVMSAPMLACLLWRNRAANHCILMDDSDAVFKDEETLSLLKHALDTSKKRKISYQRDSNLLKANGVENNFNFDGSIIFASNINFQAVVDAGKSALVPHLQAMMTRTPPLDLKLYAQRDILVWVRHVIRKSNLLVGKMNITGDQQEEVLAYLTENLNDLKVLSIRTAEHIAGYMALDVKKWKQTADVMMLR